MKKLMAVLLGVGLLSSSALAGSYGVFGSYWDPKDGDGVWGAGANMRGGTGLFYIGLRGTYYQDIPESVGGEGVELRAIPVDVSIGIQLSPISVLDVYGGAGMTYYFLDSDRGSVDNEFGWLLEAGAEIKLSPRFGIFAEGVWRDVNGAVEGNHSGDIDLNGFTVNVGLVFR